MFREEKLEIVLALGRRVIPRRLFKLGQPLYHWLLAYAGAILYGFPSRKMKIIGVTGTKGKSTVVYILSKIFEEAGIPVAAIGSLGYKIKEKEWPNTLKMTMPGRFKLQNFLKQAKDSGVKIVILEVTSEGIKQKRHLGISFDCAVLTNIHREHIESHGSFEKYVAAKKKLFQKTDNLHVLNSDDESSDYFKKIKSIKKLFYGMKDWKAWELDTSLSGDFNKYNILAAAVTAKEFEIDKEIIRKAIDKIKTISGRMEYIDAGQSFKVVIDYAHTPDSLEQVYKTLKNQVEDGGKMICVLGAAGGGRDKWKRPEFGKISSKYCDKIILTNEDPYDEDPDKIIEEINSGISNGKKYEKIIDRKEAIREALKSAYKGDVVIITGKGSELSMALGSGKKISWSDRKIVFEFLTTGF